MQALTTAQGNSNGLEAKVKELQGELDSERASHKLAAEAADKSLEDVNAELKAAQSAQEVTQTALSELQAAHDEQAKQKSTLEATADAAAKRAEEAEAALVASEAKHAKQLADWKEGMEEQKLAAEKSLEQRLQDVQKSAKTKEMGLQQEISQKEKDVRSRCVLMSCRLLLLCHCWKPSSTRILPFRTPARRAPPLFSFAAGADRNHHRHKFVHEIDMLHFGLHCRRPVGGSSLRPSRATCPMPHTRLSWTWLPKWPRKCKVVFVQN